MTPPHVERDQRAPVAVLAAAFLFNLGQGVLRPSLPLYLQRSFGANYRMVTMTDGGQILGPLLMGAVADAVDLSAAFLLAAALLMVTAWRCSRHARAIARAQRS